MGSWSDEFGLPYGAAPPATAAVLSKIYTTPGSYTFTCPLAGRWGVYVRGIRGIGGQTPSGQNCYGAGGAGYSEATVRMSLGDTAAITIPRPFVVPGGSSPDVPATGGTATVTIGSVTISVTPAGNGFFIAQAGTYVAAGGVGSGGDTNLAGGAGGILVYNTSAADGQSGQGPGGGAGGKNLSSFTYMTGGGGDAGTLARPGRAGTNVLTGQPDDQWVFNGENGSARWNQYNCRWVGAGATVEFVYLGS